MLEAKTRLSKLVRLAERGERVVIARDGVPVAELVRHVPSTGTRCGGQWKGKARIAPDFDAPMPEVEKIFGA